MSGIQNVIRKQGTYYYRKLIRLGPDKPFRLRMSLRTTCRKLAGLLAPALTLIGERVAMNMMSSMARDGLTGAQRAEIFRRQMLEERDRLETMHATLHIVPPDDHEDIGKALSLRLGASEMAAQDGATNGKVEDFLVAHIDPDDDDAPVLILAWSDIAASIEHEGAEQAAIARLAEIGVNQSALREAMARKVVNEARIAAIREFRQVLANPGSAYPAVPIAQFEPTAHYPSVPVTHAEHVSAQPAAAGMWSTMTPTEAMEKFFAHNPKTGGKDGESRKKNGAAWREGTRRQARVSARLLEQVMQGRPLSQITHDDLLTLNDCFERVDGATFLKSPRQQAMNIFEIVTEYGSPIGDSDDDALVLRPKDRQDKPPSDLNSPTSLSRKGLGLSLSTTNRHFGILRQMTNWFSRHHSLAPLDYDAFIMSKRTNARKDRSRYTEQQGREIFSLPPWTGSKSHIKRMEPGELLVHDAWYFVPMIAWYSGMRRDEICGMQLADIEQEDGIWLFVVRDNETRKIKTVGSERKLPFAEELKRLGLPEYIQALRDMGESLLFPELGSESGKGTMGDGYYKRIWCKIAKVLPFVAGGQGVHAFRHTAIDSLKAAKISAAVAADFAGHSLKGETQGRYSKDHVPLLQEAVDAIPEVTNHLVPFRIRLLPERLRKPRAARVARQITTV